MTSETDMMLKNKYWEPTTHLRFVNRDGKRILQQAWRSIATRQIEWHDVPLIEETV